MSLVPFTVANPIGFDPGIPGFVKAARHFSGSSLVMTTWESEGVDWVGMFWVKQLKHNAWRHAPQYCRLLSERTIDAVERSFQYLLVSGPPPFALRDQQKQRVYTWEDDIIYPHANKPMPWHGCILFTKYVWERVGNGKPLHLTYEGQCKTAMSKGGTIYIPELDTRYHTKPIILHEIAHELTEFDAHGPSFVSIYMGLCERFLGLNKRELQQSAHDYGVNFIH